MPPSWCCAPSTARKMWLRRMRAQHCCSESASSPLPQGAQADTPPAGRFLRTCSASCRPRRSGRTMPILRQTFRVHDGALPFTTAFWGWCAGCTNGIGSTTKSSRRRWWKTLWKRWHRRAAWTSTRQPCWTQQRNQSTLASSTSAPEGAASPRQTRTLRVRCFRPSKPGSKQHPSRRLALQSR